MKITWMCRRADEDTPLDREGDFIEHLESKPSAFGLPVYGQTAPSFAKDSQDQIRSTDWAHLFANAARIRGDRVEFLRMIKTVGKHLSEIPSPYLLACALRDALLGPRSLTSTRA